MESPLRCACCGMTYGRVTAISELRMDRYNHWHWHKDRNSGVICVPCAYVLRTEDFRRKDWVADPEGVRFFRRKEPGEKQALMNAVFLEPPARPFAIAVTPDFRKHMALKTPLNYVADVFSVQYGEYTVQLERSQAIALLEAAAAVRRAGASAPDILRGRLEPSLREKIAGIDRMESMLAAIRPSPLLSLILEFA
ncbi:MAG TPA: hypothetical protein VMS09_08645 [Paenibacillus sp.]|uniref:hypothetical protein n=1 Tax=Paenibacillus sp. TaxID=58172 RepID=UPI002B7258CC|nr:hypothetical protein [Paenibacillus sp.]HUC92081.1 hypothetical protein [Paenibacillus sp.]